MPARKSPKKKAGKSKALARVNQGALAIPEDLEDRFAKYISRDKATAVSTGWASISMKGSLPIMTIGDNPVGDETGALDVIVLGGNRVNLLYPPYVSGQVSSPICFAVASMDWEPQEVEEKMAPPEDFEGQAQNCFGCPQNEFKSATTGSGKACKNTVKLAIIPAGSDDFTKAEGYTISVPPTTLKAWSSYLQPLIALRRPVFTVVTRIRKVPNTANSGFKLTFETLRYLDFTADRELLEDIMGRVDGDGTATITQLPSAGGDDDAAPATKGPAKRRKVVRKSGAGKRASGGGS